jgi:hypothetical protein
MTSGIQSYHRLFMLFSQEPENPKGDGQVIKPPPWGASANGSTRRLNMTVKLLLPRLSDLS